MGALPLFSLTRWQLCEEGVSTIPLTGKGSGHVSSAMRLSIKPGGLHPIHHCSQPDPSATRLGESYRKDTWGTLQEEQAPGTAPRCRSMKPQPDVNLPKLKPHSGIVVYVVLKFLQIKETVVFPKCSTANVRNQKRYHRHLTAQVREKGPLASPAQRTDVPAQSFTGCT